MKDIYSFCLFMFISAFSLVYVYFGWVFEYLRCPLYMYLKIDQKIEEMFASRKRVSDVTQPMLNATNQPSASNIEKLELAKRAASKINISKNLGPEAQDISQIAAAAIMKGSMAAPQVSVRHQFLCCSYL